jgi:hypothetical protein
MSTGSTLPFQPAGTVTIAATTASAAAAIPSTADTLLIFNSSASIAFIAIGGGGIGSPPLAAVTNFPIPPGGSRLIFCGTVSNVVAVVLSASTGAVYVSYGTGTVY